LTVVKTGGFAAARSCVLAPIIPAIGPAPGSPANQGEFEMKFACLVLAMPLFFISAARAGEAGADTDRVQRAVHVCAACHGEGGRSAAAVFPSLAGQMPQYVVAQLKDFRGQIRAETDVQAYMWGVSALPPGKAGNPKLVELGKKVFAEGIAARGVRACATCHGDNAEGASVFPRLAGQHADYVFRQLKGFGTRLRPHGVLMKNETAHMSDVEMRAVAEYVQSR
jgi:cytochrome c553